MTSFTEPQLLALYLVNLTASSLTIISCIVIISLYFLVKESRTFAFRLVIYLTTSDTIFASSNIINAICLRFYDPASYSQLLCVIEGFLRQFGMWLSMQFAAVISWFLFKTIVKNHSGIEATEYKVLALVTTMALAFAILPFYFGGYGSNNFLCYINYTSSSTTLNVNYIALFYGPFWISAIFNCFCYTLCLIKMKNYLSDSPTTKRLIYRIFMYPFILIIAYIPPTIINFVPISQEMTFVLLLMTMGITHSQGLLNSLYYGMNKTVEFKKCYSSILDTVSERSQGRKLSQNSSRINTDSLKEISDRCISSDDLNTLAAFGKKDTKST